MTTDLTKVHQGLALYHVRKRLTRSRSTSRYLDQSDRSCGTICGAPVTAFDSPWADRALQHRDWTNDKGATITLCADCRKALEVL